MNDDFEVIEKTGYKVTKHNDLIRKASYNLTAEQQKFLCFVISKIKPTDMKLQEYVISAIEFAKITGIDMRNVYNDFKTMVEEFDKKGSWIKLNEDEEVYLKVFEYAKYNKNQGSLTVSLHRDLHKYLIDLVKSGNYTQYELWNIMALRSKYSIRLYELFRSYVLNRPAIKQSIFRVNLEELKGLLSAANYKRYSKFYERVLSVAIDEINKYTNLELTHDTIKQGKNHKVIGIEFIIKVKPPSDEWLAYCETQKKLTGNSRQIKGQMTLFDIG